MYFRKSSYQRTKEIKEANAKRARQGQPKRFVKLPPKGYRKPGNNFFAKQLKK